METEYAMLTTADADFHLIPEGADMVRRRCSKGMWLTTVDGRMVNPALVVSIWTPSQHEVEQFMEDVNA